MKTIIAILSLTCISASVFAVDDSVSFPKGRPSSDPDAIAIDGSCASESITAGCVGMQAGTGLLSCLSAYRKAHKGYTFSAGCEAAWLKAHADGHVRKKK